MAVELSYRAQWWSAFGQAIGGVATVFGVVFAVVQVATWKSAKLRERRADVAASLARDLDSACDAAIAALRDPTGAAVVAAAGHAMTPWLLLHGMRGAFRLRADALDAALEKLNREIRIGYFYFTLKELDRCEVVARTCGELRERIEQGFSRAEALLPEPDGAHGEYEATFIRCAEDVNRVRIDAMISLSEAASYSAHQGPVERLWAVVRHALRGRDSR